eukprot:gb/GFBE01015656.1/.p1 GENE.gb/GFBE01015656.1/~~gb/GFBE01015656.1/.p1  ORF type:complete len:267 (+),score=72.98 gb/GFBE01015656.1/:1-801(+)
MCVGAVGMMGEDNSFASVQQILMAAVTASAQAESRAVKRRVRQRLHKKLGSMLPKQEYEKVLEQFEVATKAGVMRKCEQPPPVPQMDAQAPALVQQVSMPQLRGYSANSMPTVVAVPVHMLMQMPMVSFTEVPTVQKVPFLPVMGDMKQPQTFCAVQDVRQLDEKVQVQEVELSVNSGTTGGSSFLQEERGLELSSPSASTEGWSPRSAQQEVSEDHEEDLESEISEACAEWKRAISEPGHDMPVQRTFIQFNTRMQLPRRRSLSV